MLLCAVAFQNFEDPIDILEDIKAFLGKCVDPIAHPLRGQEDLSVLVACCVRTFLASTERRGPSMSHRVNRQIVSVLRMNAP